MLSLNKVKQKKKKQQQQNTINYKYSHLYKHVTDVAVSSFSCSMEWCAFVVRFHFKVWVYTVNWIVKRIKIFHNEIQPY